MVNKAIDSQNPCSNVKDELSRVKRILKDKGKVKDANGIPVLDKNGQPLDIKVKNKRPNASTKEKYDIRQVIQK